MTQEEKQLLIKDLTARLPYGVMVENTLNHEIFDLSKYLYCLPAALENFKPYLRPMSSMTEEERKELKNVTCPNGTGYFNEQYLVCPVNHFGEQISFDFMSDIIDWLNKHHFDYHGLIEKGLALEAKEGMYTKKD